MPISTPDNPAGPSVKRTTALTVLLALSLVAPRTAAGDGTWGPRQDPPMVINISWSSPDVRYFRRHIVRWEQRPFTGTAVHLYKWPYAPVGCVEMGSSHGVSWEVFQGRRFGADMLADTLENLKATKVTRSRDNFLWIVTFLRNGHFDWFDDERWSTVLHNIESLARVAREGGAARHRPGHRGVRKPLLELGRAETGVRAQELRHLQGQDMGTGVGAGPAAGPVVRAGPEQGIPGVSDLDAVRLQPRRAF